MAMQVQLFKKYGTYQDKETGKDKRFVNFYIKCGDQLIVVEPKYFPNPKFDDRDPGFAGRKAVLEAFAELLPEKESGENSENF
ncbi:MAG: hypothetical protein J6K61_07005 [Clostridia bacterium]|nr:hypothetical protein [Clostridia bacterium]